MPISMEMIKITRGIHQTVQIQIIEFVPLPLCVCYDNHHHSRSTSTPFLLWQSPSFSFHIHSVCVMTITSILCLDFIWMCNIGFHYSHIFSRYYCTHLILYHVILVLYKMSVHSIRPLLFIIYHTEN